MSPPPAATRSLRRRWLLAGSAILLLVCLRALLPVALRIGVEQAAIRAVALPATLRNVDLDLLRGGLLLEGLTVGRRGDTAREGVLDPEVALLRWEKVAARISWLGLVRGEIHLLELSVDGARIRLEQESDGRIDPFGSDDSEPPTEPDADPRAATEGPVAEEPGWPLRLDRMTLRDLDVTLVETGASGPAPIEFQLEQLEVADVRFHEGALGLGAISIEGPRLQIFRNLTPPAAADSAREEPPPEDVPADAGTTARIDEISIERAEFTVVTQESSLDVTLGLRARELNLAPGKTFPLEVQLGVAGGSIVMEGLAGVSPPSFDGTVVWSELSLPPLATAALPELSAWLTSGASAGRLRLHFTLAGEGSITASGTARIDALRFADPGEEVRVAWESFEISLAESHLPLGASGSSQVKLDRLALAAPDLRYTLPTTALQDLLMVETGTSAESDDSAPSNDGPPAHEPAPAEPAPAGETASPTIHLTELSVTGGRLDFVDRSVEPTHRTQVEDLRLDGRDLRWPGPDVGRIRVQAQLPQDSQLDATATLRAGNGDASLALSRLTLPPFNPYAAGAGLSVDGGAATVESTIELRGSRTSTESILRLHGLELSPESSGGFQSIFGVSLDLTLALLKNVDGEIELPLRVSLDETTTRAQLLPLLGAALKQAVVGAITSPLKVLGAVLPEGAASSTFSFEPVRADPGAATPQREEADRIRGLAALLTSRPGVALTLRGRAGVEDRPLLARRIFRERVLADEELPALEDVGFLERRRILAAVRARAGGEPGPLEAADEALLDRWIGEIEVPPERTRALARQRARALRQSLLERATELDPERVRLAEEVAEGSPATVLELGPA